MATALPITALIYRRRLTGHAITLVAVALALLPLAARSVRNVPMFLLVAVPAMTMLARSERTPRPARHPKERTGVNAAILAVAATAAAAFVLFAWTKRVPVLGWQPFAPAAIDAVRGCDDPIYNTFEGGGALIWFVPERRVFIDNRQDPYSSELLAAAHQLESDGRFQSLFARYGIRCAIVPSGTPTAAALRSDTNWSTVHDDPRWAAFTRR
jgi:hypothetical protein